MKDLAEAVIADRVRNEAERKIIRIIEWARSERIMATAAGISGGPLEAPQLSRTAAARDLRALADLLDPRQ